MKFIKTQADLQKIYKILVKNDIIGVDTEFYRQVTYYAKLCLIQFSSANHTYIIDPLSPEIENLEYVKEILINPKIIKVFHAPQQDIEIFLRIFGKVPVNFFDTQLAANALNYKRDISYYNLCQKICNANIDKAMQKTDWRKRPLNDDQLTYAARDVEFLEQIYLKLSKDLAQNRQAQESYQQAIGKLSLKETYRPDIDNITKKIRNKYRNPDSVTKRLKILAEFRESKASELDIPRRTLISDDNLLKIAKSLPDTKIKLKKLCYGLRHQRYIAQELIDLCAGIKE